MATEVEGIARRCRRPIRDRLPVVTIIFGLVLPAIAGILAAQNIIWFNDENGTKRTPLEAAFIAMLFVFLFELMFAVLIFSQPKSGAVIFTRNRSEAPLWSSRNKDALVTNAIVSFVFLIIGVVAGYLLPK